MTALRSIRSFLVTLRAAARTASAVEAHRKPLMRDLKTLGIPSTAFGAIHL